MRRTGERSYKCAAQLLLDVGNARCERDVQMAFGLLPPPILNREKQRAR